MAQKTPEEPLLSRQPRHHIVEDFVIVWLDPNISKNNANYQDSIIKLQRIIDSISLFTDADQCVDYLTEIIKGKVFMIVSEDLGRRLAPLIQDLYQLKSIYIFCDPKSKHEQCVREFSKVKGVFNEIEPICNALKQDIRQSSSSLMPISIVNSSSSSSFSVPLNLNELDQSFMYTQLLKDILLKMQHDCNAKKELVEYCRLQYADSTTGLQVIDEFEGKYPGPSPIWWYTRECFTYWMLNKALRTQDVRTIIKMGFFAQDLHRQIEQLYSELDNRRCFTVYRGQGILNAEFAKMSRSKNGLLSFNNFLSTSTDRDVAKMYAESAVADAELTGVLFRMEIDPFVSSTPFASSDKISYYADSEKEILFSMHTVFRIGEMKKIDDRLWEVSLKLTSDNDEQLMHLTEHIRKAIDASTGLHRLGSLMFMIGEFDKAEEIFHTLLETISNDDWTGLASLYHMLGYVNNEKGDLSSALTYFKQSLDIELTYLLSDNSNLSRNYSGIGLILKHQGDLDGALEHFQRSLKIDLLRPQPNQVNIATHHNNIGGVFDEQGKYGEALKSYARVIEIELAHLPPRHPSLAVTYNNIAAVYDSMEDSSTALSYYEKTLDIQEKSLPSNHPSLAMVHYNIAMTLEDLHRYKDAIEHASQAVDIACRAFGPHHSEVKENQEYLDELRKKL